jgi:hypothetical protein
MPAWHEDHRTLVAVGRFGTEVYGWGAVELLDFFEEPWHFDGLHDEWVREDAAEREADRAFDLARERV